MAAEGVVQVLMSDKRGGQAPVLAAVGEMQFDVVLYRLEHEFGVDAVLQRPVDHRYGGYGARPGCSGWMMLPISPVDASASWTALELVVEPQKLTSTRGAPSV